MSLLDVARIVGVSASTVSRVINDCPRVAPKTAESVRRTIKDVNFVPRWYHRNGRSNLSEMKRVALIFFGPSNGHAAAPALRQLIEGVSYAAGANHIHFSVGFWSSDAKHPRDVLNRRLHGVLLYGPVPGPNICRRLTRVPSVWLMENHLRPSWGDHVLPDDSRIGELAAFHLVDRGHKRLAYLGPRLQHWASDLRGLAFCALAENQGLTVQRLLGPEAPSDLLPVESATECARATVREIMRNARPRPTGLFVAEACLLPALAGEFTAAGISVGRGKDLDIVTCNSESAYLAQLSPELPSIDIRAEVIGFRGMDQLCWRMRNPGVAERIRVLVEPHLTDAAERR